MTNRPSPEYGVLDDGGEIGRLIAARDWAATPLGVVEDWPEHLRTTIGVILRSPVPIVTLWGEDGVMIYNDAYSVFAGGRHPRLLGAKVREGWPEVAEFNDYVMKSVLGRGETLSFRDQELTLHRNGAPEQVWMDLDYSPVLDAAGGAQGVIAIVVETTAKVRAERSLIGDKERLRQMFEQAPGFVAMMSGPEHVFDLVNPAYMQMVGHRDLIGKTVREALPEVEGQGYFELLDNVYATGQAFSGKAMPAKLQRTPGGPFEHRFIDLVYQPIHDRVGAAMGIFVQGSDVTDHLLAEQAVRAGEARFEALAQAMPNHVWTSPVDGQLDWFNARTYEYSGAAPGELDGQRWISIVHPDDVDDTGRRWIEALADGEAYESEFRLRRADGTYRWHLARAVPIRETGGEITRWIGTNTDIDDQKAAVEALAELNDSLERQVEERTRERDRAWKNSRDLQVVVDASGGFRAANDAWTSVLGWEPSEVAGRSFLDFVHPDDQTKSRAAVKSAASSVLIAHENRYRHKDGSYRWISWVATPEDGLIYASGRHVTAEKEAAAKLEEMQAQLRQSQKMEAVGQLTGGIAHDFNNMLAVVIGSLDLLSRRIGSEDGRARRYVDAAADGARRAALLTQRLLAFSRQQPLKPEPVDCNALVSGMSDLLRHSLGAEVRLETILAAGLWCAHADPNQLENAIINLGVNARDAMPDGGRLTIETQNTHFDAHYAAANFGVATGQYVMIALTDTGSGMSPEVIAKAFDPFFTTKEVGKGTGLGLSQVYGFVKQSGGHVQIYSELGVGTTVKIYLPRLKGEIDSPAVDTTADALPRGDRDEVVLVVEDEPAVRQFSVDALGELGYQVLQADGAANALRLLDSRDDITLLFTDVVMPDVNGRKLADEARRRRPGLRVLFTTGYTRNAVIHNGVLDPGVELIGKPFTIEELAAKVRSVLEAPRAT